MVRIDENCRVSVKSGALFQKKGNCETDLVVCEDEVSAVRGLRRAADKSADGVFPVSSRLLVVLHANTSLPFLHSG